LQCQEPHPKNWGNTRLNEEGANDIVDGVDVTLQVPQTTWYATVLHFRRPYIKFRQHPLCKIA
jgi:hypothetical protein